MEKQQNASTFEGLVIFGFTVKSFRKPWTLSVALSIGPGRWQQNSYIYYSRIYIYEYIHTCPHTLKRISSLLNQSSVNASQICHFICLFSTFRLSPVACARDINYARLRQQSRHILGVSFKKSVCDLKEILWGLPGLSNLFYDSILLGLDLFLSYFFLLCFSEEEFPVLKYHFDKQK